MPYKTIFDVVGNFSKGEKWGEWQKMNGFVILLLQGICDITGYRIAIHCGYEKRESGYHPKGDAVDFHFITKDPFFVQIQKIENALRILQCIDRVGLGLYTHWNSPGFHLDDRGKMARWGWTGEKDRKGLKIYCSYELAKEYAKKM